MPLGLDATSPRCRILADSLDHEAVVRAAAADWTCPLTLELPVDPTTAEDGRVYERSAIAEHISNSEAGNLRSPVTGQVMGPRLTTAFAARETIEALVRSGALRGQAADRWLARLREDAALAEAARIIQSVTGAVATGRLGLWLTPATEGGMVMSPHRLAAV
jgi:hypothetical protein